MLKAFLNCCLIGYTVESLLYVLQNMYYFHIKVNGGREFLMAKNSQKVTNYSSH